MTENVAVVSQQRSSLTRGPGTFVDSPWLIYFHESYAGQRSVLFQVFWSNVHIQLISGRFWKACCRISQTGGAHSWQ